MRYYYFWAAEGATSSFDTQTIECSILTSLVPLLLCVVWGKTLTSNLHLYRCLLDVQGPLIRRSLVALVGFLCVCVCGFDKITRPKITQMRRGFLFVYSTRELESVMVRMTWPREPANHCSRRSPHQSLHPLLYFVQKDPPPKGFITFSNQLESNCLNLRAYEGHSYSTAGPHRLIAISWCCSL